MKKLTAVIVLTMILSSVTMARGRGNKSCKEDAEKFCSTCERGDRFCVRSCLKENEENLSDACKSSLATRKGKKGRSENK